MINSFDFFGGILGILGAIIGLVVGLVAHVGWWIIGTTLAGFMIGWFCGVGFAHILIKVCDHGDSKEKGSCE